jgi:DNA polymerase-3 subunit gamma/tau
MENYIVSARKYRPTTFDSVVGQLSITSTLKNAIKNNHLAQAFLFCGPRGVGKTTCARILAKTINCFSVTENIEACNECESCKSFDEGRSLNIYELDGASNNSVEDIRSLIEQVRFAPQIGTHKVYIIDEVHMLSSSAFNAFLKTLEEPPKHAIFILATTEKHKIIPTILSRCQIFDFNRIKINDIANLLSSIAQKENVKAEADGLHIIAQKADGAMRDALSMFDQIVSFSGGTINYQDVIDNLNILDYDYYFKVTDSILSNNVPNSLLIFNEILNNGFDGHNFINGLAEHLRNLLVCQDEKTVVLLEVGTKIKEKYVDQAKSSNTSQIILFLDLINKADTQYKVSKNQRLLVEVMLMQLCSVDNQSAEKKKPIINIPIRKQSNSIIKEKVEQSKNPALDAAIENAPNNYTIPEVEISEVKEVNPAPLESSNPTIKKLDEELNATNPVETISKKIVTSETNKSLPQEPITEDQPSETPTLKISANLSFSDTISINPASPKEETTTTDTVITNRPFKPYTPEQFGNVLNDYKILLQEKGKDSLASIFEVLPEIKKDNIQLLIENKALEDEFKAQKSEFLEYVREELSNYNIQVNTEVNKDVKLKKAYTPQEKFTKMSEKNPNLKRLVDELEMDVGYA